MKTTIQQFKIPPPSYRGNTRERIIAEARKKCPDMGDGAMIAERLYGYWVGCSVYVDKESLNKERTRGTP